MILYTYIDTHTHTYIERTWLYKWICLRELWGGGRGKENFRVRYIEAQKHIACVYGDSIM
jgi:hypothetical protein